MSKLSPTKILAAIAVSVFSQMASATATVNWSTWTAPAAYPYKATTWVQPASGPGKFVNYFYTTGVTGSLVLPGPMPTTVSLNLAGEVMSSSCWQADWSNCDPKEWWYKWGGWGAANPSNTSNTFPQGGPQGTPPGTFTSPMVPDLPSNSFEIATVGSSPYKTQTITFSQPLSNVVLNIFSLGRQSQISTFVFDQPFRVLSQNPDCVTNGIKCFVVSGNTISGLEGSGTLFFEGPVNAVSWTITGPEDYTGYNLGVSYSLVTVTAANANGTYGGAVPPISYTATGFNGTDNFTTAPTCQAYTDATYATLVTPTTPPGTYVTHCSGAVALTGYNYDISYVDGTYTVSVQTVNGGCGTANGVFTQTPPATADLCSTGTPSAVTQLPDGSFSWSCAGKGAGTSSSCGSNNGKPNQALRLGPTNTTVRSGRGATLRLKGAKGTGKVTYSVAATSGLICSLRFISNAQVFVKTRGRANGSCKVVANKAGDARYNPATSNVATVNVNCANP